MLNLQILLYLWKYPENNLVIHWQRPGDEATYIHGQLLKDNTMRTNLNDDNVRGILEFRVRLKHLL